MNIRRAFSTAWYFSLLAACVTVIVLTLLGMIAFFSSMRLVARIFK